MRIFLSRARKAFVLFFLLCSKGSEATMGIINLSVKFCLLILLSLYIKKQHFNMSKQLLTRMADI